MARLAKPKSCSGKRILLVDDNENYATVTQTMLTREGHDVILAYNGLEALNILRQQNIDLVLLDYFMPGGLNGEQVVEEIRKFNEHVQIILQTGYSGERPAREMMHRLEIQGYHDKTDGPEKLLLWVDVGLKAAYTNRILLKSRQGLRYILDVTPDMYKIQDLDHLLKGILVQITDLLGTVNSFLAVVPEDQVFVKDQSSGAFLAFFEEEAKLKIQITTGKFDQKSALDECLDQDIVDEIYDLLKKNEIRFGNDYIILPLTVGETGLGVIFLEQGPYNKHDVEILQIFANQAAVAIQNIRLYTMATCDKLTGTLVRSFFEQCLLREIRSSFRHQRPLSLIMIDLDGLKSINDVAGHIAGDMALAFTGKILRNSIRTTDFVGRYGGDEFAIILPDTPLENVVLVTKRILEQFNEQMVEGPYGKITVRCSAGVCGIEAQSFMNGEQSRRVTQAYFEQMGKMLIETADKMLYQAKKQGRNCAVFGNILKWMNESGDGSLTQVTD